MKWIFIFFALFSATINANDLYKCKVGSSTSIQSQPCPPASQTIWKRSVTPDSTNRSSYPSSNLYKPTNTQIVNTWSSSNSSQQKTACDAAREHEASYRKARGLKITFDEISEIQRLVYDACK